MKKENLYEVYYPLHMYSVYRVYATTKKEAIEKVKDGRECEEICQDVCPPGKIKSFAVKIEGHDD